jgi:hypothetical protein
MSKGSVIVNFTIGFGNNLFQYVYGRLLAEKYDLLLNHPPIEPFNIAEKESSIDKNIPFILIDDNNCKEALENFKGPANYYINGYFEDFTLYKPCVEKIRSWFPKAEVTNKNDLILHFRLQNRLIQATHCQNHVLFDVFDKGIQNFDFDKLHIVTDAKKWDSYKKEDIEEIQEEIRIGPNPPEKSPWVSIKYSLDYMNHLIDGFSKYNPIVHCNDAKTIAGSGGLRSDFMEDFNLIRNFDKIMFKDSTFSWWSAFLSEASHVSPFGPWKPNKGPKNKNLGLADFPGWNSWGGTFIKDHE